MEDFFRDIKDWVFVLGIIGSIFGFYFNTRKDISTIREQVKDQKKEIDKIKNDNGEFKSSLAVIEESQANLKEILTEIKGLLNG